MGGGQWKVGVFSTRHTRAHEAGSKHGGWGVCAQIFPQPCEPAGRNIRGLRTLALSTLRLTTLAKTKDGASQRPSVLAAGPMFVYQDQLGDIPLGHPRAVSGQRRLSPRFQIQRVRTYRPTVRTSTRRCVTRPARADTNPTQTFQNVVRQCNTYHGKM